MADLPTEADFRANLAQMRQLERDQAELFAAILEELEDPSLRAVFEGLHRDEVSHGEELDRLGPL